MNEKQSSDLFLVYWQKSETIFDNFCQKVEHMYDNMMKIKNFWKWSIFRVTLIAHLYLKV